MSSKGLRVYSIIFAVVIALSTASNLIYASYQKIQEPLFMAMNDEICYNESINEKLTISYISNNSDTRRIESIKFDNLDAMQLVSQTGFNGGFVFTTVANDNPYNDQIGRYYTFKRGYVNLHLSDVDISQLKNNGSLEFGDGTAIMSDGTGMRVSFGSIVIHTKENWDKNTLRDGASGSNDYFTVAGMDDDAVEAYVNLWRDEHE